MSNIEQHLTQLYPEPDAEFLTQLDTMLTQEIQHMQTLTFPQVRPVPQPRWWLVAAASVLVVFMVGLVLSAGNFTADDPLQSTAFQATPTVSPQVEDCTAEPQTGWLVHRPTAEETLDGLASRYGVTLDEVLAANCLTATSDLPSFVYIPLEGVTTAVIANSNIHPGMAIMPDMLDTVTIFGGSGTPITYGSVGLSGVAVEGIPAGTIISPDMIRSSVYTTSDGQTLTAGAGNVFAFYPVPIEYNIGQNIFIMGTNNAACSFVDQAANPSRFDMVCPDYRIPYESLTPVQATFVLRQQDGVVLEMRAYDAVRYTEFFRNTGEVRLTPVWSADFPDNTLVHLPITSAQLPSYEEGNNPLVTTPVVTVDFTLAECDDYMAELGVVDCENLPQDFSLQGQLVSVQSITNTDNRFIGLMMAHEDAFILEGAIRTGATFAVSYSDR